MQSSILKSFVVIYYGNSGSSWLMQAIIASDSCIYVPGYEPIENWGWKVDDTQKLNWIKTAFNAPAERSGPDFEAWLKALSACSNFKRPIDSQLGFNTVGFKMSMFSISQTQQLLDVFKQLDTRVLILNRVNRIKHTVSLYRFHSEGKSQFAHNKAKAPSYIAPSDFEKWLAKSNCMHEANIRFKEEAAKHLPENRILTIEYEDFITPAGKARTLNLVGNFLGTHTKPDFTGGLKKATPDNLHTILTNFDELSRLYIGTPLESYFR